MPVLPSHHLYVPSEGRQDASIIILGEAPGASEHIKKRPFIGTSGKLLFGDILIRAGIQREQCFITNVVPVRPPDNHMHKLITIGVDVHEEMALTRARLQRMVMEHPRKVIIALGNTAMECLLGRKVPVSLWRGSLLPGAFHGTNVFPMIHPAAIFREYSYLPVTRNDASRLKRFIADPDFDVPPKTLRMHSKSVTVSLRKRDERLHAPDPQMFIDAIHRYMSSGRPVSVDIETYVETITVVGLAISPTDAISIPFTGQFSIDQELDIIDALRDLLTSDQPKIFQNGIYDCTYFADKWGIGVHGYVYDTLLMHHAIASELPHSLAFLTSFYTDWPYYKSMSKEASGADYNDAHWEYNALDVTNTYEAWEKLCGQMDHFKRWDIYWNYYWRLNRNLGEIQRRGFRLNIVSKDQLRIEMNARVEEYRMQLMEHAREVGFDKPLYGKKGGVSSQKLASLLYDKLRMPKQYKKVDGKKRITTDKMSIAKLRRKYPQHIPILDLVRKIQDDNKMINDFLKSTEDPDGIVRTSYNIAGNARKDDAEGGTETGRLSSGTNPYGRGCNMQNQPKSLRDMYIPRDGYIMWQADWSAAESYAVAWSSGDHRMLEVLTRHPLYDATITTKKIFYHEMIGAIALGIDPAAIVGPYRDLAKRVGHAWNYGMAPQKCADIVQVNIPDVPFDLRKAKAMFHALDVGLQGVVRWRGRIRHKLTTQNMRLFNCWDAIRIFFGRYDDETFREAYAWEPQSTVGMGINFRLNDLEDMWRGRRDVYLLGQTHDSMVGECLPGCRDEIEETVRRVMETPLPMVCEGMQLRIPVDIKFGNNWKEVS